LDAQKLYESSQNVSNARAGKTPMTCPEGTL
jgi:hypothetical protein